MNYHAHIYWQNPNQRWSALKLRQDLEMMGCILGSIHDIVVGPHPLPMYQVKYNHENKEVVEEFLYKQNLNILLHEDVGVSHVRDHTEGARWINGSLPLDLIFLSKLDKK